MMTDHQKDFWVQIASSLALVGILALISWASGAIVSMSPGRRITIAIVVGVIGIPLTFIIIARIRARRRAASKQPNVVADPLLPPIVKLPPIHVFLPDPNGDQKDPFYQDGAAQQRGFDQGMSDAGIYSQPGRVKFYGMDPKGYMTADRNETALLKMKSLYESSTGTVYVITMSAIADEVKKEFSDWHDQCAKDGLPPPVLIITVASAPNLSASQHGIVRWYVRLEEECKCLAKCLKLREVTDMGIFYVTTDNDARHGHYGIAGRDEFTKRFEYAKNGTVMQPTFDMTDGTAWDKAQAWLEAVQLLVQKRSAARVGVFVVGYGDALRATLSALIEQGFDGLIACTSTLTERAWQPRSESADERIITVMPEMKSTSRIAEGIDRDVVFLFTRETLRRVLAMTQNDASTRTFMSRWVQGECEEPGKGRKALKRSYEPTTGDSIFTLQIADHKQWRWKD